MGETVDCQGTEGRTLDALISHWIERHGQAVLAEARKWEGRATTAEDVFQETFLVACRKVDTREKPNATGAWLRGIARNVGRRCARKRAQRYRVLQEFFADQDHPSSLHGSTPAGYDAMMRSVLSAAETLSPKQKAIIHMLFAHGMSVAEIAGHLGVSSAAVRQNKSRALSKIKELLAGQNGDERKSPSDSPRSASQRRAFGPRGSARR